VIAVTATDTADVPGYFAPVGNALELTAPGVEILSTVARGGYDYLSGTSQAAPHVTGAAALYMASNTKDVNGDGTVDHRDVRQLLQSTATDLGAAGKDAVFGYGLVNARGAAFTADDDDGDGQCGGWISQLVSYVVDHLFSRLVPVEPSPETQKWLKSTQTALSRFLDSVWTWKTSGPRSVAGMFGKR
jgi:subtilisin family serine protease